jgi:hypothetical protein
VARGSEVNAPAGNNHAGVVRGGAGGTEPRGKGNFCYVMIDSSIFLLISSLITKCRHSYEKNSNVRREGRRIRKKT